MSALNAHHFSTTLTLQLPVPVAQLSLLAVLTTTESSFSVAASLATLSTPSTMYAIRVAALSSTMITTLWYVLHAQELPLAADTSMELSLSAGAPLASPLTSTTMYATRHAQATNTTISS